jgi:CRISPR-associated protein Cas2
MLLMTLERVSPSLRGELTRWLIEVQSCVFVGTVSAHIRDTLWQMVQDKAPGCRCVQVYRARNEQGFAIRVCGDERRAVVDFDGLMLVAEKTAAWKEAQKRFAHRDT